MNGREENEENERKKKKKKRKKRAGEIDESEGGGTTSSGIGNRSTNQRGMQSVWLGKIQQHPEMLLCESLDLVFTLLRTIPSMVDSQRAKNNHLIIVSPEWNQP